MPHIEVVWLSNKIPDLKSSNRCCWFVTLKNKCNLTWKILSQSLILQNLMRFRSIPEQQVLQWIVFFAFIAVQLLHHHSFEKLHRENLSGYKWYRGYRNEYIQSDWCLPELESNGQQKALAEWDQGVISSFQPGHSSQALTIWQPLSGCCWMH